MIRGDVFRMVAATATGAIAFAALPVFIKVIFFFSQDSTVSVDISVVISAALFFLGEGALLGLIVSRLKLRTFRAAFFGLLVALVQASIVLIIVWSVMTNASIVANILYYALPGFFAGLASGFVATSLGEHHLQV